MLKELLLLTAKELDDYDYLLTDFRLA